MSAPSSPSQSKRNQALTQAQTADGAEGGGEASGLASAMKSVSNSEQAPESVTQSLVDAPLNITLAELKAKGKELREAIKQGKNQSAKITQMLNETPQFINLKLKKPCLNEQNQQVNIECDLLGYTLMTTPDIETLLQIFEFVTTQNEWVKKDALMMLDEPLYQRAFHFFLKDKSKDDASIQIDFLCELAKYIQDDDAIFFAVNHLDGRYFEPSNNNNLLLFSMVKNNLYKPLSLLLLRLDKLKAELENSLSPLLSKRLAAQKATEIIADFSNQKDSSGNTILHYVYQHPNLTAILTGKEDLIKNMVDPLIVNNENRTALGELLHQINTQGMKSNHREALAYLMNDEYYSSLPDEKKAAQELLADNP